MPVHSGPYPPIPRYLATLGLLRFPPVVAAAALAHRPATRLVRPRRAGGSRGGGPRRPRGHHGRTHRGEAALLRRCAARGTQSSGQAVRRGRRRRRDLEEAVGVPLCAPPSLARVEPRALVRRQQGARLGAHALVRPALRADVHRRRLRAAAALVADAGVEACAGAVLLLHLQAALELLAVEAHLGLVGDLLLDAALLVGEQRLCLLRAVELGVGLALCRPHRALRLIRVPLWVAVGVERVVEAGAVVHALQGGGHLRAEQGRCALVVWRRREGREALARRGGRGVARRVDGAHLVHLAHGLAPPRAARGGHGASHAVLAAAALVVIHVNRGRHSFVSFAELLGYSSFAGSLHWWLLAIQFYRPSGPTPEKIGSGLCIQFQAYKRRPQAIQFRPKIDFWPFNFLLKLNGGYSISS